ncbi:MAG: hypothetical protein NZL99_04025 [Burkholderiaceae bacterium]|nr:hypothetical protein [Burkholderiaceae bacterium]MCX8003640.1 hypothetical protein [Burkholderiaceae bacterium]
MAARAEAAGRHAPLINAGLGAVALLLGALVAGTAGSEGADALRALPLADARGLAVRSAGEAVVVEGWVAADLPVIEAGLVALQRQRAVGVTRPGTNEIRFTWVPQSTQAPALRIDTPSGAVTLVNTDVAWRDPPRVAGQPGTVVAGSTRVVGFAAGDPIAARGTVADAAASLLRADEVFGGTHTAWVRSAALGDEVPRVIGAGFALAGAGLLIAGAVGGRRMRARSSPY